MRALIIAPALLALAACAGPAPRQPAEPPDPAVAECRAEVRNSQAVRDAWRTRNPNMPFEQGQWDARFASIETAAVNDCLRRRGIIRGGGVEPVRQPSLF
jgi:membrane-bound lytic murein transglycosylase B